MWKLKSSTQRVDSKFRTRAEDGWSRLNPKDHAFLMLPNRQDLWAATDLRAKEIRKSSSRLVVLGMGGSSLGTKAIQEAFARPTDPMKVEIFDHIDAKKFWRWFQENKDLSQIHWVPISKSGNTMETMMMAEMVDQHLRLGGFRRLHQTCTVITEPRENKLSIWAKKESVSVLNLPVEVGGRFSVLSPVGMLPAAFMGVDISEMRLGAAWALDQRDLVNELTAQTLASFEREEWITVFWPYCESLRGFGLWVQQLWAESLAKTVTRNNEPAPRVSTPLPCNGAGDQHSVLQQFMEGAKDKFHWFFRVKSSEAESPVLEKSIFDMSENLVGKSLGTLLGVEAESTSEALHRQGVQSLTLETAELDARSLSALFMIMQLVIANLGECLDINAFNQPGVELGKDITRERLKGL